MARARSRSISTLISGLLNFRLRSVTRKVLSCRGLFHEFRDDLAQAFEVRRLDHVLHGQRDETTTTDGGLLDHDALRQVEALHLRHHIFRQFILCLGALFGLHERYAHEAVVGRAGGAEARRRYADQRLTFRHGVHHVDDVREVGVHQFEAGALGRGALHHEAALVLGGRELALQVVRRPARLGLG
jgi:hypothetical protein